MTETGKHLKLSALSPECFQELTKSLLSVCPEDYLILTVSGRLLLSTLPEQLHDFFMEALPAELPSCGRITNRSFSISDSRRIYSVLAHTVRAADLSAAKEDFVIFRLMRTEIPVSYTMHGIAVMDRLQAQRQLSNSFHQSRELLALSLPEPVLPVRTDIVSAPLMITGETGSGKDQLAYLAYLRSRESARPLYIANCAMLNEKSWHFLLGSSNSPLTDEGNSICFSNINALSAQQQKQLLSVITDANLAARNRLLFSCGRSRSGKLPHAALEYTNMLGLNLLPIPPLREQPELLKPLIRAELEALNHSLGTSITGLKRGALSALLSYDWPFNRTQLERVLKAAMEQTGTGELEKDAVLQALQKEQAFLGDRRSDPETSDTLLGSIDTQPNTAKSLDGIIRDIVRHVLKSCGGNRSLAAKQLGISRTTLWRYLKDT